MPYIVPHALHDKYPFILNEKEKCFKNILKPSSKIFFFKFEICQSFQYGPYCFPKHEGFHV